MSRIPFDSLEPSRIDILYEGAKSTHAQRSQSRDLRERCQGFQEGRADEAGTDTPMQIAASAPVLLVVSSCLESKTSSDCGSRGQQHQSSSSQQARSSRISLVKCLSNLRNICRRSRVAGLEESLLAFWSLGPLGDHLAARSRMQDIIDFPCPYRDLRQ
jgi:hypothetical protein